MPGGQYLTRGSAEASLQDILNATSGPEQDGPLGPVALSAPARVKRGLRGVGRPGGADGGRATVPVADLIEAMMDQAQGQGQDISPEDREQVMMFLEMLRQQ